jgi:glycosyltransferase involved in cell wall biosynthesis
VVIPAYNASAYIDQTLHSVANQDMTIDNIIIVNDGSVDNTQKVVEGFIKSNKHLKITLINQANAGLSAARNTGISQSNAEFIALLDADDLWKPHKLSSQIKLFKECKNTNLGVVYCAYELIDNANNNIVSSKKNIITPRVRGKVYKSLMLGNFISASASGALIKRIALNDVGLFDEKLKACEDWDMWIRIAKKYEFDFVNIDLVSIRLHSSNMQKDLMRMLSAELMVLNKFIQQGEKNPFLLWKIRTYLSNTNHKAQSIIGFEECCPKLKLQITGWRMKIASLLLSSPKMLTYLYLKISHKR